MVFPRSAGALAGSAVPLAPLEHIEAPVAGEGAGAPRDYPAAFNSGSYAKIGDSHFSAIATSQPFRRA